MSVEKRLAWLEIVAGKGSLLLRAPKELKSDKEVVLTAVAQNGSALEHAAEALKSDRDVVLTAVEKDFMALRFAADDLLEDESFAKDTRQLFYFFKLTTALSGRSCIVAQPLAPGNVRALVYVCCRKLGLQSTDRESLLFGDTVVPEGYLSQESPGCPGLGKLVEYQLVL
eukprot:5493578-Amphidinium_carterae.1